MFDSHARIKYILILVIIFYNFDLYHTCLIYKGYR